MINIEKAYTDYKLCETCSNWNNVVCLGCDNLARMNDCINVFIEFVKEHCDKEYSINFPVEDRFQNTPDLSRFEEELTN